jgi:UDP-N-acetylglucosamine pyrophosphorylase
VVVVVVQNLRPYLPEEPEELVKQTDADGSLRFNASEIAIHALHVSFIERLNHDGELKLPWHRAKKKVTYVFENGESVKPETRVRGHPAGEERDRL